MEDLVKNLKGFYNDRTVLVTGHTGFKGTWLTRTLLMLGANVTGYSLDAPTVPSMFGLTDTGSKMQDVRGVFIRSLDYLKLVLAQSIPGLCFILLHNPLLGYRTKISLQPIQPM